MSTSIANRSQFSRRLKVESLESRQVLTGDILGGILGGIFGTGADISAGANVDNDVVDANADVAANVQDMGADVTGDFSANVADAVSADLNADVGADAGMDGVNASADFGAGLQTPVGTVQADGEASANGAFNDESGPTLTMRLEQARALHGIDGESAAMFDSAVNADVDGHIAGVGDVSADVDADGDAAVQTGLGLLGSHSILGWDLSRLLNANVGTDVDVDTAVLEAGVDAAMGLNGNGASIDLGTDLGLHTDGLIDSVVDQVNGLDLSVVDDAFSLLGGLVPVNLPLNHGNSGPLGSVLGLPGAIL